MVQYGTITRNADTDNLTLQLNAQGQIEVKRFPSFARVGAYDMTLNNNTNVNLFSDFSNRECMFLETLSLVDQKEIVFEINVDEGDYTCSMFYQDGNNKGIASIYLNGETTPSQQIDMFGSSGETDTDFQITLRKGINHFLIKNDTKNASSSDFRLILFGLIFKKNTISPP